MRKKDIDRLMKDTGRGSEDYEEGPLLGFRIDGSLEYSWPIVVSGCMYLPVDQVLRLLRVPERKQRRWVTDEFLDRSRLGWMWFRPDAEEFQRFVHLADLYRYARILQRKGVITKTMRRAFRDFLEGLQGSCKDDCSLGLSRKRKKATSGSKRRQKRGREPGDSSGHAKRPRETEKEKEEEEESWPCEDLEDGDFVLRADGGDDDAICEDCGDAISDGTVCGTCASARLYDELEAAADDNSGDSGRWFQADDSHRENLMRMSQAIIKSGAEVIRMMPSREETGQRASILAEMLNQFEVLKALHPTRNPGPELKLPRLPPTGPRVRVSDRLVRYGIDPASVSSDTFREIGELAMTRYYERHGIYPWKTATWVGNELKAANYYSASTARYIDEAIDEVLGGANFEEENSE